VQDSGCKTEAEMQRAEQMRLAQPEMSFVQE
jgi:hypothetical protein